MKAILATILPVAALLSACAGSPARLASMSAEELRQQTPMNLCNAYHHWGQSATIKQVLTERNIVRSDQWEVVDAEKIRVGMTDVEAVCAWGYPDKVNRASYGDQWVYGIVPGVNLPRQYVYVRGGVVTAWN
jgi:hypothetical protein